MCLVGCLENPEVYVSNMAVMVFQLYLQLHPCHKVTGVLVGELVMSDRGARVVMLRHQYHLQPQPGHSTQLSPPF